jgi:hypothetical protein
MIWLAVASRTSPLDVVHPGHCRALGLCLALTGIVGVQVTVDLGLDTESWLINGVEPRYIHAPFPQDGISCSETDAPVSNSACGSSRYLPAVV